MSDRAEIARRLEAARTHWLYLNARQMPIDLTQRAELTAMISEAMSTVRRLQAELDGIGMPWHSVEQIAAYVRGDGTDAQRVALADGILEGRRVD